jgi:hypothetical protein
MNLPLPAILCHPFRVFLRFLDSLRCRVAAWILRQSSEKRYGLARRIAPDTTSLIQHRPRRLSPLFLPPRSHLIYHQNSVDTLAAENSIASLAPQQGLVRPRPAIARLHRPHRFDRTAGRALRCLTH